MDESALSAADAAAIRLGETRFRRLVSLSSDWYWEQDSAYRFCFFSEGLLSRGHARPEDLLGHTRWDLMRRGKSSLSEAQIAVHEAQVKAHQPFRDFEYCIQTADGDRYYTISGDPLIDDEGAFAGYFGVGRDITPRRVAEKALSERNAELEAANARLERTRKQLVQAEKMVLRAIRGK